jgi:tRNA(fMet)-specific endonuclease VapC
MKCFLDTNICIYFLKGKFPLLLEQLKNKTPADIRIASIVKAELLLGAYKSNNPKKTEQKVTDFLLPFSIIPFDDEASIIYSKIRGSLEKRGQIIGPNDLILAATVLANDGIMVTNNEVEFRRIKELKIENWIK